LSDRPLIGVSVSRRSGWRIFPLIALNLWLAAQRARRWDTRRDADVTSVQGIVIGGGDDIAPDLYGGELHLSVRLDPGRDAQERALVEAALTRDLPLLGICRGAQMINVALGGTLLGDAYGAHPDSERHRTILPRKRIEPLPGTHLAAIAGAAEMRVNALHSQAVDRLGAGLRVAARDAGGMVQGVERAAGPLLLGVQWHPEHLVYARRQRALFAALVRAAAGFGGAAR